MILRTGRPGRRFVMTGLGPGAESVELPPEIAHRVRDVLRMREGESVELLDGAGRAIEGGLTREEIKSLEGPGGVQVSLGSRVLRAETAVIAMATLGARHPGWPGSPEGHNRG